MIVRDDDTLAMQMHDAEDNILGVAMIYADGASDLAKIVQPNDFYRPMVGKIFEVVTRLNLSGTVGIESVWLEMKSQGLANCDYDIGWLYTLTQRCGTLEGAKYYASKLKELKAKTQLAKHFVNLIDASQDPGCSIETLLQLNDAGTKRITQNCNSHSAATSSASSHLVDYLNRIQVGNLPQLIQQRGVLNGVEIGSGLVTVIGAPPGFGKTALAMQVMFDAIELDDSLTAVVANAETTFDGLLRRELTRITRIDSNKIRFGNLDESERVELTEAASELIPRLQRVSVLNDPNTLMQLMRLRSEAPGLVIVDYLQKFAPCDKDARQGVGEVMAGMRSLAKAGWKVLCLSATSRGKDGKHDSKQNGLSSFRESGEIEYNADSAYLMHDNGPLDESVSYIRHVTLQHVKNRHGAKVDHELKFHMPRMSFEAMPQVELVPLGGDEHDDFAPWRGRN